MEWQVAVLAYRMTAGILLQVIPLAAVLVFASAALAAYVRHND